MDLSSDGSLKGKRKLVIEEASGPAWGAQSYAANRNYAINKSTEDSEKDSGLGDFGRCSNQPSALLEFPYSALISGLGYQVFCLPVKFIVAVSLPTKN